MTEPARLLRIHCTERDRCGSKALHEAIVEKCMEMRVAGATVFRGLEGYGDTAELHRGGLLAHDRPVVVEIVDTAENIERLVAGLGGMIGGSLVTVCEVRATRVVAP